MIWFIVLNMVKNSLNMVCGISRLNTEELRLHQRTNSLDNRNVTTQQVLVGIVVYDYLAHNNKELTIRAGEKVYVSIIEYSAHVHHFMLCSTHVYHFMLKTP